MSMFWLGGPKKVVSPEDIYSKMYEDRIFLPGVIHGGDYLVWVYLNDACEDGDEFIVSYITKELILEAHQEDPEDGELFYEYLLDEAETFTCRNDGSGDFAAIVEAWPEAVEMDNSELVDWAKGKRRRKR